MGGAPGKIDLYVGKEVVRRGIPMDGACDQLIELIKEHDRWQEKEVEEERPRASASRSWPDPMQELMAIIAFFSEGEAFDEFCCSARDCWPLGERDSWGSMFK